MNGILLVDKPAGWTSHDVVAKVRNILRAQLGTKDSGLGTRAPKVRVGHTGTLDPAATGLLILLVGAYTKKAAEFSKLDKTYEAEITLGATSSTGDSEGTISSSLSEEQHNKIQRSLNFVTEVTEVLTGFVGEILQTPPAFSAIKVDGQRAYKLAREGKAVKLKPRKVTIYDIRDVKYDYPKLSFTTYVSSGTYIRSLAEDIGRKLGTGAYLSGLRRTRVGKYLVDQAKSIDKVIINDIIF